MPNKTNKGSEPKDYSTKSNAIDIPQISLPKGGGAIKSIDEKFQVNAVNGTASFEIPFPLSPNRNGFTPQLSLSYNSGTGNSLFGIGWSLGLTSIQRQTDKKLPRYRDTDDLEFIAQEDSYMFSGIEELVAVQNFRNDTWEVNQFSDETRKFIIRQYRPRIEGSFSRIERIHCIDKGFYWKVTSGNNISTFFGYSEACRITHPNEPEKIYSWLPEFSFDNKGSCILYEYKPEDLDGVANEVHEKNRFNANSLLSNKHLKRIKYGNAEAWYTDKNNPYEPQIPQNIQYHFEMVLDYGEHSIVTPKPNDNGLWKFRQDAWSVCRPGFEMRNYRLCQRALMFHIFPELNGGIPTLVKSIDFDYDASEKQKTETQLPCELTYLTGITQKGYIRKPDGSYSAMALPKMTFDYQWLNWDTAVKTISAENLAHAPTGLSDGYQWVDLYSEGISGILSEQANGWFYKSNLGEDDEGQPHFSHAKSVMPKPSLIGIANEVLQLQDLEASGQKQMVVTSPGLEGFFELSDEGEWQPFVSFLKTLNLNLKDPNIRMIDVNGDGKPEVVLSEEGAFWWWENQGKIGYDSPELAVKPYDEEKGPAIVFADQKESIFLADMSGDGMSDIVRITNREICYWANLGFGRFGAKVTMGNSPAFDLPELFNPKYLQLADISGTGATDIIYLGKNKFKAYLNFSGNSWSDATEIDPFFPTEQPNKVTVTDLLGNGTSCIIWSSEMPAYSQSPMRYIDLMGGLKPHIMKSHENGMGKKTDVEYKSSTHFYLQDKRNGTPWITKLTFPVQCVSKTVITERVTQVRFTSEYSYHHGYYDQMEREFRGFGRVEQLDTEYFEVFEKTGANNTVPKELHQAPVLTKTWFHTGAFLDKERILTQFKKEYWHEEFKKKGFDVKPIEFELSDARLIAAANLGSFDTNLLSAAEWREALRACKSMTLRQEVFALDATDKKDIVQLKKQATPYSVATHNCEIQLLQQRGRNKYAVFIVKESEAITWHYERNPEAPRIAHTMNIKTDELGNVLESVSIVYPRIGTEEILKDDPKDSLAARNAKSNARKGQQKNWIIFTKNDVTNDIIQKSDYQLRKGWQTRTYELTGFKPKTSLFTIKDFKNGFENWPEIEYQQVATEASPQKRLIEHIKTKFYNDELTSPLPNGQQGVFGIPYESYQLAYTPNLLQDIFTPSAFSASFEVTDEDMRSGKFFQENTDWWIRSGTVQHRRAGETLVDVKNHFFAPVAYTDPFESKTEVFYDTHTFFMERARDAVGNETKVLVFSFRTLSPIRMQDANDNISSVIVDELELVKAAATEGKDTNNDKTGEEADNLDGLTELTSDAEQNKINEFLQTANQTSICNYTQLQSLARDLLLNASARMVYDLNQQPTIVASIVREQHTKQNHDSPLQISFEYTDGLGKVAMKKVQAEPGAAKQATQQTDGTWKIEDVDTGNQLRWVGNGRTVLNNKGNPIKQYEPYFSTTPAYEDADELVESGVTPVMYYDAISRLIKTEMPNGTFSKVEFDAWKEYHYDANDSVKKSNWYTKRITLADSNPEKKAALKAEIHYNTPNCIVLDTLGRPTLGIDHNRFQDTGGNSIEEFFYTFSTLDIEGNALSITDARGNVVMQYRYDLLGHRVAQTCMDAGKRWMFNNSLGNPVKSWDERKYEFSFEYDALHRPTGKRVIGGDGQIPLNLLYEKTIYGENQLNDKQKNLRGKAAILYDTAGKLISEQYDFKGNLLKGTRIFAKEYKNAPDWNTPNPDNLLDGTDSSFTTSTEYDALNRPVKHTTPDGNINMSAFNPAGLLEHIDLKQGGQTKSYVKSIDYDAKGQRMQITYGNNVSTIYDYDLDTFRLTKMRSQKNNGDVLQDLKYTYDPVGNITQVEDKAIPTVFFNNQKITGKNEYTYDALYRLITANGREQHTNVPVFDNKDNWNDAYAMLSHNTGDVMAMHNYEQRYQYDGVGNILQMQHIAGANHSWTRDYGYESKNCRLKNTTAGSNTYIYPHHPQHGFITAMPHLQRMDWNFKEELQATSQQLRNDGGSAETTFYVYDSNGQRARKITENQSNTGVTPTIKEERIYVGNYELYKNENGLERETLHVMDSLSSDSGNKSRIAMIDTETEPRKVLGLPVGRTTPIQIIRYQMGNHLGSVSLELDDNEDVISYEEYHPYGTTAYQAKNKDVKAAAKRYRFTGMERDEESGLEYHGARYYIPWLGRWATADPIWLVTMETVMMNGGKRKSQKEIEDFGWGNHYQDQKLQSKEHNQENLGIDGLSTNLYAYVDGQPIIASDQLGLYPTKDKSTTITQWKVAFEKKLIVDGKPYDRGGTSSGFNAIETLKKYGETTGVLWWTKPTGKGAWMDEPTATHPTKESKRFIYTKNGGWIDMVHFIFYASRAYQYLQSNRIEAGLSLATKDPAKLAEMDSKLRKLARNQALSEGETQEFWDKDISSYSYEDLPSDWFGADFGANYFDPNSSKTLAEQVAAYLQQLVPTEPSLAPNWSNVPDSEAALGAWPYSPPKNETFLPMYTTP